MSQHSTRLRSLMERISERCYCAGWLRYLEYDLWFFVTHLPHINILNNSPIYKDFHNKHNSTKICIDYGQDYISLYELLQLRKYSESSACWYMFIDNDVQQIPLPMWKKIYDSRIHSFYPSVFINYPLQFKRIKR